MKKFLVLASFFFFLFVVIGSVIAAENLDGWSEYVESGTVLFTPNGETLALSIEDDPATNEGWGKWYKDFPGAYGVMATCKVESYSGSEVAIGLRKYVGLTNAGPFSGVSGNPILAEIFLEIWENNYRISYRVRERNPDGTTIKYFAKGVLGDYDSMWNLGDQVTIGMAAVGQDIYFYTPDVGAFTKVELLDGMSPITSEYSNIEIDGWVWNTDGYISGEVSNLILLQ